MLTGDVKQMIITALHNAGGPRYLLEQARDNPNAFLQLVGKVLPHQVTGVNDGPVHFSFEWASAAAATPVLEPEVLAAAAGMTLDDEDAC